MEWRDEGIILGTRRHGETSAILELMTRDHGRHLGLVRGGRSRRMQPLLQAGNRVDVLWRARIDEHLGMMQVEPV
ncbi:MAG: DNA repair protein RecO, partial [Phyllobacterium sp.]